MPEEIFDENLFIQLSGQAEYCAVKRLKRVVKLKLRSPKRLFTFKADSEKADGIIKKLRCKIVEV